MPITTTHGAPSRPAAGMRIVRELPLVLEPVTPDPFIDSPEPPGVITPQRPLVLDSLLRIEEQT